MSYLYIRVGADAPPQRLKAEGHSDIDSCKLKLKLKQVIGSFFYLLSVINVFSE